MTQFDELKDHVSAKQKRLEAHLLELRADARSNGRADVQRLEAKLEAARQMVVDGWNDLSADVAAKLNSWLEDDGDIAQDESESAEKTNS